MRLSTTSVFTPAEEASVTAHVTNVTTPHNQLRAVSGSIDMKAVANTAVALGGTAAQHFCPRSVVLHCTAVGGAGLNGDITVSLGTTAGGTEIAPAAALTGLNLLDETFRWELAGVFPVILGNANFFVNVTIADTGGGTGTMVAYVEGDVF